VFVPGQSFHLKLVLVSKYGVATLQGAPLEWLLPRSKYPTRLKSFVSTKIYHKINFETIGPGVFLTFNETSQTLLLRQTF